MLKEMATWDIMGAVLWYEPVQAKFDMYVNK